jgi:ribosome-associated toxin RatA of RatAB toxin-antitoxin module
MFDGIYTITNDTPCLFQPIKLYNMLMNYQNFNHFLPWKTICVLMSELQIIN